MRADRAACFAVLIGWQSVRVSTRAMPRAGWMGVPGAAVAAAAPGIVLRARDDQRRTVGGLSGRTVGALRKVRVGFPRLGLGRGLRVGIVLAECRKGGGLHVTGFRHWCLQVGSCRKSRCEDAIRELGAWSFK